MQMDFIPGGHWHVRVVKRDGKQRIEVPEAGSIESHLDRLNLEIEKGVVTAQTVG